MQRAIVSGLVAVAIGLAFTFVASLIWPPPWTLGQAMIAVGVASFFAAASVTLGASRRD